MSFLDKAKEAAAKAKEATKAVADKAKESTKAYTDNLKEQEAKKKELLGI